MVRIAVCVGCGLFVNGSGVLEVQRRPGGGIECDNSGDADDGLFLNLTTNACLSGDGTTASPLAPVISPDACNGLECRGNGLYIRNPRSIIGITDHASPENTVLPLVTGTGGTFIFNSLVVTINNPSCHEVVGRITVIEGGMDVTQNAASTMIASFEVNINGAGFIPVIPRASLVFDNRTAVAANDRFDNLIESNLLSIGAGASATYQARMVYFQQSGTGILNGAQTFEFQWDLNQV